MSGKSRTPKAGRPQLYVGSPVASSVNTFLLRKTSQLQTEIPDSIGLGFYAIDLHLARMLVLEDGSLGTEGRDDHARLSGTVGIALSFHDAQA